ncbi:L,D-transpeptidase family protein [Fictibacillus nanhaiensis]|uniref:L,D-transpeptidase family protein n=1 Tax=Fictibacillus nanhaiensis TaxID=742169 RepID=UPI003C20BAC9
MKKFLCVFFSILTLGWLQTSHQATHVEAEENYYKNQWEAKLNTLHTKRQVIIVTVPTVRSYKGKLYSYEKMSDGNWKEAMPVMKAVIGKTGVSSRKLEGDGKSPAGKFMFGTSFGSTSKPSGMTWPFKKTTINDYWVDDSNSSLYNRWVTVNPTTKKTWRSAEKLLHPLYKYATVIRYNDDPIVKGKGSAIFLHIWKNENSPTLGCVAISETNIVKVLRWINSSKRPIIIIGTEAQIAGMIKN